MKVLVTSDTHIPQRAKNIPSQILKESKTSDALIHCGDFTCLKIYEKFKALTPQFFAVSGNLDDNSVVRILPPTRLFKLDKFSIGMLHGALSPQYSYNIALETFKGQNLDLIIYGHAHHWHKTTVDKTIILNPGSPTDSFFSREQTFAIIILKKRIEIKKVILDHY